MGLLRGLAKSLRWLIATGWGLAVLFGLWRLELSGQLGPSLLWDPCIEFVWIAPTLQHPEVVALLTPGGIEVLPLEDLEGGRLDAPIAASINLVSEWRPSRPNDGTFIARRQTSIRIQTIREVSPIQAQSARAQFISLQREWGNSAFVAGLDSEPHSVATRAVVRWDIIGTSFRAVLIPLLLAISVPINVVRSLFWIWQQLARDVERGLLDRGLCPKCRYDVAVPPTSICPECCTNLDEVRRKVTERAARSGRP